jgi:plasmid stabilization system protein ParE
MKYLISFTDTAKYDLRDIAIYIAEQSKNKDIAKAFVKELTDQCARLEGHPLIGALPNDRVLLSSEYRFFVYKEYLIFYSIDEPNKKVYIQAVFNAKKDYTRVFKKLK